jgi:peroxiredoxin
VKQVGVDLWWSIKVQKQGEKMNVNKQVALGEPVDDFELIDVDGKLHRLSQYQGSVVVITFWSAECPVSEEYDGYFDRLPDRHPEGQVTILGVDSNVSYDQDEITKVAGERGIRFSVLRDADCTVADRFGALTTPHVYIVDEAGRLAYEGAVDDRTFRQREATVNYVDQALGALLSGETPEVTQTQPYGCTIVRHS